MQFRKTTSLALAAAVAAMFAASQSGVRAQDAPPAAPGVTTAPDATLTPAPAPMDQPMTQPMSDPMPMSGSMGDMAMPNFSLLNNKSYDHVDLQQAKARGLSDSQIATTAKIADEADVPFSVISAAVERGVTFPYLAGQYNLKLADVYKNDKYKQQIAEYAAAYDAASLKSAMMPPMMPMGGDSSTMPMTPPMTTEPMTPPMDKPMAKPNTATLDIVETAMAAKNLTTLVKALEAAGLVDTLKTAGPFTVFAPDDKAFAKLPAGALDALMADPAKLKSVLSYHVIPAEIMAADAKAMTSPTSPPTVEGDTLQVTQGKKGRLKVNDATVIKGDIRATNGVIHIIDTVLMPPTADSAAPMAAPADGTTPMTPPADGTTPMTPPADGTTPMAPPADGTTPAPAPAQ